MSPIIPTTNQLPACTNGANVDCEAPFNLQETARAAAGFIQRIDETAQKLDAAVSDVRRLVLNNETLTNLSAAVGNLRDFSEQATNMVANINLLVATNGEQIDLAVSNVVFFSQDLIHLSDDARGVVSTNGAEISAAVKNIKSSTETLKTLMDDLQSGQGLAGTLLKNEQLSTNVQAVAANLAIATSNLNQLGLWHFLWHHELPPTNAPPKTSTQPTMTPLWAIRILFLSLCIGGGLRHQPGATGIRWHQYGEVFGMLIGFGFGGLMIALDEMLKGFSLRAFSATTFGLLLGMSGRAADWPFPPDGKCR